MNSWIMWAITVGYFVQAAIYAKDGAYPLGFVVLCYGLANLGLLWMAWQ